MIVPELVQLAQEFLGQILENIIEDKVEWLPYGNPRMSYAENVC